MNSASASEPEPKETDIKNLSKKDLIQKIVSLQSTLSGLTLQVESVCKENELIREENATLEMYIDNLMKKIGSGNRHSQNMAEFSSAYKVLQNTAKTQSPNLPNQSNNAHPSTLGLFSDGI